MNKKEFFEHVDAVEKLAINVRRNIEEAKKPNTVQGAIFKMTVALSIIAQQNAIIAKLIQFPMTPERGDAGLEE